jgi:hypothetical protein
MVTRKPWCTLAAVLHSLQIVAVHEKVVDLEGSILSSMRLLQARERLPRLATHALV